MKVTATSPSILVCSRYIYPIGEHKTFLLVCTHLIDIFTWATQQETVVLTQYVISRVLKLHLHVPPLLVLHDNDLHAIV